MKIRSHLLASGFCLLAISAVSAATNERPDVTGLQGMVTSNHPLASAAGLRILVEGGNAFDAAVAVAAATSVVDPSNSSLGGNGFATIYVAKTKEVRALNFFGTAPGAARPELFTHESLNEGILSSPVPSNLEGYRELLSRYGTMDLARVLRPAIELAEDGFVVTPYFMEQVSVVDSEGNMVALTQTLGAGYGAKVVVGDTGLIFSNQMRHMHLEQDSPSQIRGGMRPRSNQSPTIILRNGKPVMALGTPGGDGIWQRLAQVIVNVLDFGMSVQQAVSAPRFSYGGAQETGSAIAPVWRIEQAIAPDVLEALEGLGHRLDRVSAVGGMVNGVIRDPETGALHGGADPRGRSYAIGY